ncbi:hypothetical protein CDV31_012912 [Fusarium ambrosium]|uniref:SMP-30/Gluconolactonase/LRE-like region domain-containing protein n=1 Tax=Fusarium ambrosium TaxID=131363 RepID=A0A428T6S3_9HYPO|nr:hypothetical protein CDV31_012912 [Fusarium ambrosium]
MMENRAKAFVTPHTDLGESPLYRAEDDTLHYVDVLSQKINILQLSGNHERRIIDCPEPITFLAFHQDGGYLICSFSSIVHMTDDGHWTVLKQVFSDVTKERLNDAGIDALGRLWVGSIDRVLEKIPKGTPEATRHQPWGCIYRYDTDGTLSVAQQGGVGAGNGLCWSPDGATMYHVDSYFNYVSAYDFDLKFGTISNKRLVVTHNKFDGEFDGLLTDANGDLYTFIWDGGAVIKYSSSGELIRTWDINAARVTHGAWVGSKLDKMIVTTAKRSDSEAGWEGEEAGALFYVPGETFIGLEKHVFGESARNK